MDSKLSSTEWLNKNGIDETGGWGGVFYEECYTYLHRTPEFLAQNENIGKKVRYFLYILLINVIFIALRTADDSFLAKERILKILMKKPNNRRDDLKYFKIYII
jgi:hypothetical protein